VRAYLDINATMPPHPEAVEAMIAALRAGLGNPSSVHAAGRLARRMLERARGEVAELLGVAPERVVFTSGGTEANAAGLWALAGAGAGPGGRVVLVSAVEHPSVQQQACGLERLGARRETIPVDTDGIVDFDALERLLAVAGPGALVCIQAANSETGVLQPLGDIAPLLERAGAVLHCDAVQAAGKVPLGPAVRAAATLAIAGHKLGAPPGAGALAVREGIEPTALIAGRQERGRRGGTENVPAATALGVAARLARARLDEWERLAARRDRLEGELLAALPGSVVWGQRSPRLSNTVCLGLPGGLRGAVAAAALDLAGVAVSSGPACSSGVELGSPAVAAMGGSREQAEAVVRISLAPDTSDDALAAVVVALKEVVGRAGGSPG
jgi:cysteine desulfurase